MGNPMESTQLSIALAVLVIFAMLQRSTASDNVLDKNTTMHRPEESTTMHGLEDRESYYIVKYNALPWQEAKASCEGIGGGASLAFPTSKCDFRRLQRVVRGIQYKKVTGTDYKLMAWLGINNLDDYHTWRNLNGDDINRTEFHTWAGNNGGRSSNPMEPHCAGVDALNPGLRGWWCHLPLVYICRVHTF